MNVRVAPKKKDPCQPTDVCLVIGEPFVDLVRLSHPFRSRRISPDEALNVLREEDERGHIHTAWFKNVMLNRFYAICNCCRCCCLGMKFTIENGMKFIIPSGYVAEISKECKGCGKCSKFCQFDALENIEINGGDKIIKKTRVNYEKCYGCGVCESRCNNRYITLRRDTNKGEPLDIRELAEN